MYYPCNVKFKDNPETVFGTIVKDSSDVIEVEDDHIFFYCDSVTEIEALMDENNNEDFVITQLGDGTDDLTSLI